MHWVTWRSGRGLDNQEENWTLRRPMIVFARRTEVLSGKRVGKFFDKAKVLFFKGWFTCINARPIIWLEEGERKEIPKASWPTLNQGTINYYCYDKTGDWESYCSKSRHSRCFLWSNEWLAISQTGAMLQTQAPRSREGSWWHPAGNQVDNNGRVEYLRKNLKVSAR